MDCICYRKRRKYTKYKLEEPLNIKIEFAPPLEVNRYKIFLSREGNLNVEKRYTWDGPSGPALDTRNFMCASLVHDVLYQLMRLEAIDRKTYRKQADRIMRKICRQDGMNAFRAWYCYRAVRLCAGGAARPQPESLEKLYAPRNPESK